MKFNDLKQFYSDNYSLGYINAGNGRSNIENRFVLISLINYVHYKTKLKNPDITHYEVIMKLNKNAYLPEDFIRGLAIVCEDFAYGSTDFPTFGFKGKDILKEIDAILKCYLPF